MVHTRGLRHRGAAPAHRDGALCGRVSSGRLARSSRTASPDPGSLVVRPHGAGHRAGAGEGEAFGHATQFSRSQRAVVAPVARSPRRRGVASNLAKARGRTPRRPAQASGRKSTPRVARLHGVPERDVVRIQLWPERPPCGARTHRHGALYAGARRPSQAHAFITNGTCEPVQAKPSRPVAGRQATPLQRRDFECREAAAAVLDRTAQLIGTRVVPDPHARPPRPPHSDLMRNPPGLAIPFSPACTLHVGYLSLNFVGSLHFPSLGSRGRFQSQHAAAGHDPVAAITTCVTRARPP